MTDEQPPIFRTWRNLYTFVLLFLLAQIILYYLFTRAFE